MPINMRTDKLYYSHTMEYSSALKWNIHTSNNTKEFSKHTERKKNKQTDIKQYIIMFMWSPKMDKANKLTEWIVMAVLEDSRGLEKGIRETQWKSVPVLHINYTSNIKLNLKKYRYSFIRW